MKTRGSAGELIHLVRPDGTHPDALLHVCPEADPLALLVAFNPGKQAGKIQLTLSLHYAGFDDNAAARVGDTSVRLDSSGRGSAKIELEPFEIKYLPVRRPSN